MAGFDARDIRRAMDVYTRDNVYLGTVLAVLPGPALLGPPPAPAAPPQGSALDGEALGPMPTQPLGNPGPRTQGAAAACGTSGDGAAPLGLGALIVGRWWGLRGRRIIPLDAVQTVSLERVVLNRTLAELERA